MQRRVDPHVAEKDMRNAGLEPLEAYPGRVATPWLCRCATCEQESNASLMRIRAGGGCRYCGWKRGGLLRRLDHDEAADIMRAAGLEPQERYAGVGAAWLCLCTRCGQLPSPSVSAVREGKGCRFCAGNVPLTAEQATEIMHQAGATPLDPYPGSSAAPWRCRCATCGNIGYPRTITVQRGHGACRSCSFQIGGANRRAALADQAVADMLDADYQPLIEYPGTGKPWPCRCLRCSRPSTPMHGNVVGNGTRCIYCSETGFAMTKPAVVYVLHHAVMNAVKVGITGTETKRLANFQSDGWQVIRTAVFDAGADAYDIEQRVLSRLRGELAIPQYLTTGQMLYRGETETADAKLIKPLELWALVVEERDRQVDGTSVTTAPVSL